MILTEKSIYLFYSHISKADFEMLEKILDENCVLLFPKSHSIISKTQVIRFFKILRYQYPALDFIVEQAIIGDGSAAVHWKNVGRKRDGNSYENEGVTILKELDNKIIFISDFFKNTENF